MITGVLAALVSALVFGAAAVRQAHAARALGRAPDHLLSFVLAATRSPAMLVVVAAYLVGFLLHAVAIWLLPLYLAQAMISLSMPVTALLSAHRLREPLDPSGWAGVAAVTVGIVLLGLSAGAAGEVVPTGRYTAAVWALVLFTLLLGALVHRRGGSVALGAVAGLGYAGSALAVRGVGTDLSLPTVLAAVAVPSASLVAFWLYSTAMTRIRVAPATAGLLVVQTFAPAVIGLLALGDGVRDGFGWLVAVGLVACVTGAVTLAARMPGSPGPPALVAPVQAS